MAAPVLHIHTAQTGLDALPSNAPTVETIKRIQHAFVGEVSPAEVAVQTPSTDSAEFKNAVNAFRAAAIATGKMHGPIGVDVNAAHDAARIEIPLVGNGTDAASNGALLALRNDVLPSTIGTVQGTTWAVTGGTAASYDANSAMKHQAPIVFGFVLAFAFLLLLVSFRSIVIATKAIVLNLLSVAAAYGVVIVTFQWGWGENLLHFNSNGGIAQWLPVFMFVILFGLSMDYHVFILSRIREAYDRGLSTEDAVAHGIKTTAGTVSSAALVMVGVFLIFATLPFLDFKEMGIGLAAAVLIDATIVRGVLLPATMKLLGDWNWYLPSWLTWLPRIEHGEEPRASRCRSPRNAARHGVSGRPRGRPEAFSYASRHVRGIAGAALRRDHDSSVTAPPLCGYAARSEHSHVRAGDGVPHVVLLRDLRDERDRARALLRAQLTQGSPLRRQCDA